MSRRKGMLDVMSKELSGADLLAEVASPEAKTSKKPARKVQDTAQPEEPQEAEAEEAPTKPKKRGPAPDPKKAKLVTTTIRLRSDQHKLLRVAAVQAADPGVKADGSELLRHLIDRITQGARSDQAKVKKLLDFILEEA